MGIDQQQRIRFQSLTKSSLLLQFCNPKLPKIPRMSIRTSETADAVKLACYRLGLAAFCFLLLIAPVSAQIPTIELSALSRVVGQAASTFPLRVTAGAQLDEVDQFRFSHPGIKASLQSTAPRLLESVAQPSYGSFDVTISPEVPPGVYEARARGRFGLSNPRSFLVTSAPVQYVEQEHSTLETALDLSVQQVTVDRFFPQKRNYYRLTLNQKQNVRIVAHAHKLDSRALVALTLINPQGQEVARGRTVGEFPAELNYNVATPGNYTLVAYDFLYQGGDDFHFALQACVDSGDGASVPDCELDRLCGSSLDIGSQALVAGPSGFLRPRRTDPTAMNAQWIDAVPPTEFSQSTGELKIPFVVRGSFAQSPSISYDFQATAGQTLWIEVCSAQLDQLTDPRLLIYKVTTDAAGKETLEQLLEQDDAATIGGAAMRVRLRDPYISFQVPEAARYRLVLSDNDTGRRPVDSRGFVLSVRAPRPTFELLAYQPFPSNNAAVSKQIASNLLRGGTEAFHVLAMRKDGFNDAIELRMEGLPAGVSSVPTIIPPGASDTMIILRAADDAADWTGEVQVSGRSLGASPLERTALASAIVRGVVPTQNAIESRLAANLGLSVNGNDLAPLLIALGDGQAIEMARGGKLPFPIRVTRRGGGNTKCLLRPQSLPPKTTLAETAIEADKNEATAELQIAPDAAPGEYTFWMQNEAKIKWRQNPQALERAEAYVAKLKQAVEDPNQAAQKAELEAALKSATEKIEPLKQATAEKDITAFIPSTPLRIRIVDAPFRPIAVAAISSKSGIDQEVEIKIERLFGFAEAVDIKLSGNPTVEGLAVVPVQIAAGTDAAKLVIKIPAITASASTRLPIKMDYKFNGHALSQTMTFDLNIESVSATDPTPKS